MGGTRLYPGVDVGAIEDERLRAIIREMDLQLRSHNQYLSPNNPGSSLGDDVAGNLPTLDDYILVDGTRPLTGNWDTGGFGITCAALTVSNIGDPIILFVGATTNARFTFDDSEDLIVADTNLGLPSDSRLWLDGSSQTIGIRHSSGAKGIIVNYGTPSWSFVGSVANAGDFAITTVGSALLIGGVTDAAAQVRLDEGGLTWAPSSAGAQTISLNDSLIIQDDSNSPTASLLRIDYQGTSLTRNLIACDAVSGGPGEQPFAVNAFGITGDAVAGVVNPKTFVGTGVDDATFTGSYAGDGFILIQVTVATLGPSPNTFLWKTQFSSIWNGPVSMSASPVALGATGISVQWADPDNPGHVQLDEWTYSATSTNKLIPFDSDTNTARLFFRNTSGAENAVLFDTENPTIDPPYIFLANGKFRAELGASATFAGPLNITQSPDPTLNFQGPGVTATIFYDSSENAFDFNQDMKLSGSSPTFSFGAGGVTELLTILGTGSLNNNYLFGGSGDTVALNVGIISTAMISSQAFNFSTSAGTAQFTGAAGVNFIAPAGDINFTATSGVAKLNSPAQVEQYADIQDIAEPTSPTSDYTRVFHDVGDGELKVKKSSGDVVSLEGSEMPFAVRYDDVGGGIAYSGEAVAGSATSAAAWRVKRLTSSGPDITVEWADGDTSQDNIWDNRASLSYS